MAAVTNIVKWSVVLVLFTGFQPLLAQSKEKPAMDATDIAVRLPNVSLKGFSSDQVDALRSLLVKTDGTVNIDADSELTTPGFVSGVNFDTSTVDPYVAIDTAMEEFYTDISRLYSLSEEDSFESTILVNKAGESVNGYTAAMVRYYKGFRVHENLIHFHFVRDHHSKPGATLVFTGVVGRINKGLENLVINPEAVISVEEAVVLLELDTGAIFELTEFELQIFPGRDAHLAYRLDGLLDGIAHMIFIDAYSGKILLLSRQQLDRTGTIRVRATNPNEAYSASTGKTLKPLPFGNIYRGVSGTPIRGNPQRYIGTTTYHGTYDIPTQSSDGTICTRCWAYDNLRQTGGSSSVNDVSEGVTNLTRTLYNMTTIPEGATTDLPWTQTNYAGRRNELAYHFSYAYHYFSEYFGLTVRDTDFKAVMDSTCNECPGSAPLCHSDCGSGSTSCNSSTCFININCGSKTSEGGLYGDGEINTRDTAYHEYMHNVDRASRGYWVNTPAVDCPNQSLCFTESLGPFGAGLLSAFESEVLAYGIGDDKVYPADYYCNSAYAGVPFTNIFNDYVFFAGPVATQSILWHLPLINSSTRIVDCHNVPGIENCSNTNTFYKHLITKARDPWNTHWRTVFEVSKAFHNRITDADPQITCSGGGVQIGDPDNDTFPWADDMTNVAHYAPFFSLNNPPVYNLDISITHWGTARYGPGTCTSTSPSSCKRLALDYTWDIDKWGLIARAGEEYFLKTTNDHLEVDTKMEIRDAAGDAVVNQCGANGTSACLNDDCPSGCSGSGTYCSCLTFKPTTSAVYRVYVYPYHSSGGWNSEVGSNAKYSLTIDQVGDDFGDTYDAATPVPPDGNFRLAHLNSNDPEDYDWFYVVLPANDTLSYSLCSLDGSFSPLLNLYDQNRTFIRSYWGHNCSASDSVDLPKGLYYARIWNPGANYGAYLYSFTTTVDIGNTPATAFNLNDTGIVYPNAVKAVPSVLSSGTDKDVFRFWASQGRVIQLDVEANFSSGANPMMRIITPAEAYKNRYLPSTCVDGLVQSHLSSPTYILQDRQGGVARDDSEIQRHSHISMTAPRSSYYYVEISNQSSSSGGYVFHFYPAAITLTSPSLP